MSWIWQYRKTVFTAVLFLIISACTIGIGVLGCFLIVEAWKS